MATRLNAWLQRGWRVLRQLSGDDAYERYLAHHAAHHANTSPLPRKEFFQRQQQQKWNGIKRCC
ncbi:MAG: putative selenoprotein [Sideroxydans sp.]|nr:putative selenoprotein [Sideroxydans sp.]